MLYRKSLGHGPQKRMKGFTLLDTVAGMVLLAVIALVTFRQGNAFMLEHRVAKVYRAYHGLDDALDRYVRRNFRALLANGTVTGVASAWAPTVQELMNQGYLDNFVQTKLQDAGQLSFTISTTPAGCNMALAQCNIEYLVKPQRGVVSLDVATKVLQRLGASGLINDPTNVNIARSWDAKRQMPSPLPVANALFLTRLFPSSYIAAALPVDGSRPLTGDWDLGDHKLTGVGNFSTDRLVFTTSVTEGTSCTNSPGYKSFAMGTNHYLQICNNGAWVHANEDVTVITNHVIHTMPPGGWGSGGNNSGAVGGYVGSDGQMYATKDAVPGVDSPCGSCNKVMGPTDEAAANNPNTVPTQTPTDDGNEDGTTDSGGYGQSAANAGSTGDGGS